MAHAVTCVIPARWASSRFPGKMLAPLEGAPLIVHTLRRAAAAGCFAEILCLTDAEPIARAVRAAGFHAELVGEAANGTDRIGRNLDLIATDLIVNLQGDEPVFPVAGLRALAAALAAEPAWVHVLVHADEPGAEEILNPHRVKAALDADLRVVDFYRDEPEPEAAERMVCARVQMGAYGYGKDFLRQYAAIAPSDREIGESHELLRRPDLAPVRARPCEEPGQAVDVPQDLETAAALLRRGLHTDGKINLPKDGPRMTIINPTELRTAASRGQRV